MPEIAAARFVRYAGSADLTSRVCPPYDVIDDAGRQALEAKSPENYVRLILPQPRPGDGPLDRYVRARKTLDGWIASGVMARDREPSLFLLEQEFVDPTTGDRRVRRGIQAVVRLREFKEGVILPHERTLSGPKADRLELMKAVRAHLSPIFILYPDPANEVLGAAAAELQRPPTVTAEAAGATHRAWRVTDPAIIRAVTGRIAPLKGYIADGHHRYETALEFRARARQEGRKVEGTPLDYIPAFLCGMSDPGLVIFPTHRLVHSMEADLSLLARASPWFEIAELPGLTLDQDTGLRSALASLAEVGRAGRIAFLVADTKGGAALITLRRDAPLQSVPSLPAAPSLRSFDISILHAVIFEHLLGMSREAQERQLHLRYEKDARHAVARVRSGEARLAFLLNPTRMDKVREIAEAGEVMPQKSTYFYPKIIDGLALQLLDDDAGAP
jgi:uncharacterized protein (DUF1015 family)